MHRAALALLVLVAMLTAAPAVVARSSFGISIALPGIGIGYSDHGYRHGSWGGYTSARYSTYGGYYGGSPYYSSFNDPYYQPYYRPSYGSYYSGRHYNRPSRVVYYDRHDRGYRGHRSGYDDHRYDRRYRDDGNSHQREGRQRANARYERRSSYYDRGR